MARGGLSTPSRGGGGRGQAPTYEGTTSIYGPTRGDSVGYMPANPKAYRQGQARAFKGSPGKGDGSDE